MKASLDGRLKKINLAKSNGFMAILEAVVNSIQALSDRNDGIITIKALRNSPQKRLDGGGSAFINDVIIEDNGPGFNPDNLTSFNTMDSTYKEKQFGCKGVGRLLWLKAFKSAIIESTYQDGDQFKQISFEFNVDKDDYSDVNSKKAEGPLKTTITLKNCRQEYIDSINVKPSTLARKILNHCFASFILGDMPEIKIEYDGDEIESVNLMFNENKNNITNEEFDVTFQEKSEHFKIYHVHFYNWMDPGNRIEYCADNRTVKAVKILPNVDLIDNSGKHFTYCAYVSSNYLNENVNDVRDDFTIPQECSLDNDYLPFKAIQSKVESICKEHLKDFSANDLKKRRNKLDKIVKEHPDVAIVERHYPNILDDIDSSDSDEKIYTLLNEKASEIESKMIFKFKEKRGKKIPFDTSKDVTDLYNEVEEVYKNNLTKYILHRKLIIELFDEGIKRDWSGGNNGEYRKEAYIHDMLLPRKSKPGDILDIENCNLWMIDERLNYYSFTSAFSDSPRHLIVKDGGDSTRPDIFVFSELHNKIARSVSIIELKRPNRKDPEVIDQVINYFTDLRENEIETPKGPVRVADSAVLSAYLLVDLTTKDVQKYYISHDFSRSHDGTRFYKWYSELKIHFEVIDYNKLTDDANIRNQIFFDILNIKVEHDNPTTCNYYQQYEHYINSNNNKSDN